MQYIVQSVLIQLLLFTAFVLTVAQNCLLHFYRTDKMQKSEHITTVIQNNTNKGSFLGNNC